MRFFVLLLLINIYHSSFSQTLNEKIFLAIKKLEADSQCKHGLISLYVVDSKTGKVIFDKNSEVGLAPASCQKVITSVAAFELLGKNYSYKTNIAIDGIITGGVLNGNLYITGMGDPTMGSWRYSKTKDDMQLRNIAAMLLAKGITQINGNIITISNGWETQATPNGWIWEDIGNYYGAGPWAINWHENQYDLSISPGKKQDDAAAIIKTAPKLSNVKLVNELTTGAVGSGDNAIIYLPERSTTGYVRGTVPAGEKNFTISGSFPNPPLQFLYLLKEYLLQNNVLCKCRLVSTQDSAGNSTMFINTPDTIGALVSPPLDSINYWFLKKSVNLYGEALVKTIAWEKKKTGSTDTGINIIKDFWRKKGIETSAINIIDGSGLSPANRVTTNSLVTVMQYALSQVWYPSFYNALPEINGLKMKSGSIGGVISYTGYIKNKAGNEYTFSFIINNYNGNGVVMREKMWKLLDVLK